MKLLNHSTLCTGIVLIALSTSMNTLAAEGELLRGQGKSPCSEFMDLVNGSWSHPLNALNFHGFMSWAQGMISGYNTYSGKDPILLNMDEVKMALVDYCRTNPEAGFGDAVSLIISQ